VRPTGSGVPGSVRVVLASTLIALASGLALVGAFEPVGLWVLAPLGVAGATWSMHRLRERRLRVALLPALVLGAAFQVTLLFWMRVIGVDAWIGVGLLEGAFYTAWALATVLLVRLPGWPAWVSLAWVATETARGSWPFGGFPWGRLAFASPDSPYAAGLPWWGSVGTSLLMAATGVALVWAATEGRRRPGLLAAAAIVLLLLVGVPHVVQHRQDTSGTVRVAAVQGDVPGPGDDVLFDTGQLLDNHVDATVGLADRVASGETPRPDVVVWPENSTTSDPFTGSVRAGVDTAVGAVGVPLLVGAIVDAPEEGQVLNQGVLFTPGVGAGQRYTKWHPVPFGEFIPYRDSPLLGWVTDQVSRLDLIPRDMLAGDRTEPIRVPLASGGDVALGDAICFDVAYDDGITAQVAAGAEVLVVQTSNAMFIDTNQIDQQFEITRMRAMETGRTTVVAAINGVSGVIGPDGEVTASAAPRTQAVVEADVPRAVGAPPSVTIAPWLGRLALLSVPVGLLLAVLPYGRRRGRQERGRVDDAAARREGRPTRTDVEEDTWA
jgi:apolipoprotein N-acyltransferase